MTTPPRQPGTFFFNGEVPETLVLEKPNGLLPHDKLEGLVRHAQFLRRDFPGEMGEQLIDAITQQVRAAGMQCLLYASVMDRRTPHVVSEYWLDKDDVPEATISCGGFRLAWHNEAEHKAFYDHAQHSTPELKRVDANCINTSFEDLCGVRTTFE